MKGVCGPEKLKALVRHLQSGALHIRHCTLHKVVCSFGEVAVCILSSKEGELLVSE